MVSASRKSRPLAPRSSPTASTPERLSEGWLPSMVRWVSLMSRKRAITPLAKAAISGEVRASEPNRRALRPFATSGARRRAMRAGADSHAAKAPAMVSITRRLAWCSTGGDSSSNRSPAA